LRKISIVSNKGGTGKTTTVHNLSAAINSLRKRDPGVPVYEAKKNRVLMIDLDPQSNLSFITKKYKEGPSIYDVITGYSSWKDAKKVIKQGLEIITADERLVRFDIQKKYRFNLKDNIKEISDYEYILIDCPPSIGYLTQSAIVATGEYFLPLQAEYLAMRNVSNLLKKVDELKRHSRNIRLAGVILSVYNTRRKISEEGKEIIKEYFGKLVFETAIRNTVAITEATAKHKDVISYRSKSPGAMDFLSLAREVLNQGG